LKVQTVWTTNALDCTKWCKRGSSTSETDARKGRFDYYTIVLHEGTEGCDAVFERAGEALLRYEVFPLSRLRYRVCSENGKVTVGTTIVQNLSLGPLVIDSAVRVLRVIDSVTAEERTIGFTYLTLKGHPERGIATFRVVQERPWAVVRFSIESWSRPGTWVTVALSPVARWIQRRLTSDALKNFKSSVIEN